MSDSCGPKWSRCCEAHRAPGGSGSARPARRRAAAATCPKTSLGDIEDEVMCPVCGTPLGLASEAPQAQRERAYIERLIASCKSKDEVKRALVASSATACWRCRATRATTTSATCSCTWFPPSASFSPRAGSASRCCAGGAAGGGPGGRRGNALAGADGSPARRRHGALRPVIVIAQESVDTTIFAAFAVGFISFISPCVLPLVPGYLSDDLRRLVRRHPGGARARVRCWARRSLFCLSFTAMFVALGMTATGLGSTLQDHRAMLRQISGVVIIALGVLFIATLFVPRLNREWRPEALMRRAGTGGPIDRGRGLRGRLDALHRPHARRDPHGRLDRGHGRRGRRPARLLLARPGRAVPPQRARLHAFSGVFSCSATTTRDHRVSGVVLIVMGVLLYTSELTRLNAEALRAMDDLGHQLLQRALAATGSSGRPMTSLWGLTRRSSVR